MHEDVVHTLDDTMAVDPDVLTVRVAPVAVHPDAARAAVDRLVDGDDERWRRCAFAGGDWLGLLHDDDGFPVDLPRLPVLYLDHDVAGRLGRLPGLIVRLHAALRITVVRHFDLVGRIGRAVSGGALVIG